MLRTIGLALASAGGALLVAPVALPAGILAIAGYLTVAGTVMTAVSQAAVDAPGALNEPETPKKMTVVKKYPTDRAR